MERGTTLTGGRSLAQTLGWESPGSQGRRSTSGAVHTEPVTGGTKRRAAGLKNLQLQPLGYASPRQSLATSSQVRPMVTSTVPTWVKGAAKLSASALEGESTTKTTW